MGDITFLPHSNSVGPFKRLFLTPGRAFFILVLLMLLWVAAYLYTHRTGGVTDDQIKNVVSMSSVGYLTPEYDDAFLESIFPIGDINTLKVEIKTELDQSREQLFEHRKRALRQAGVFACTVLGNYHLPADLAALGAKGELNGVKCLSAVPMAAPSDDIYTYADVEAIIGWFKAVCPDCVWPEPQANASGKDANGKTASDSQQDCDQCKVAVQPQPWTGSKDDDPLKNRIAPGKRALYYFIVHDLEQLICQEQQAFSVAKTKVRGLFHGLQFGFLHLVDNGWIMELVFWSIMGVLGNTMAGLIEAWRQKDEPGSAKPYDPEHFMLVIPKLVLAPVMSLIMVAMLFNGWLDIKMNLNNQPIFLVLAFTLGYASERVNRVLRRAINKLVSKLEFSETNFAAANSATRMLRQVWKDVADTPVVPTTGKELQAEMVRQVMARVGPIVLDASQPAQAKGS